MVPPLGRVTAVVFTPLDERLSLLVTFIVTALPPVTLL